MKRCYTYKSEALAHKKPGQKVCFRKGCGYYLTPTRPVKPTPVPPPHTDTIPPSIFTGKGIFTTSNTDTAVGYDAEWTAIQMDPEGDHGGTTLPGTICWWMARPTEDVLNVARHRLIPVIFQAESEPELQTALDLGRGGLNIPHALIGNPGAWKPESKDEAVRQGWDLILEWYWNNIPSYTAPNAEHYPLFRNVCFGTFASETVPGRRVSVTQYREVWKGPFSIWDTEGATGLDRVAYNA